MKQVIDDKVYNTETATRIGSNDNGYARNDLHYLWEGLYVTKKGAFFLHRDGGAYSTCARYSGGNAMGDERLEAISKTDAVAWCKRAGMDVDAMVKHFGAFEEA